MQKLLSSAVNLIKIMFLNNFCWRQSMSKISSSTQAAKLHKTLLVATAHLLQKKAFFLQWFLQVSYKRRVKYLLLNRARQRKAINSILPTKFWSRKKLLKNVFSQVFHLIVCFFLNLKFKFRLSLKIVLVLNIFLHLQDDHLYLKVSKSVSPCDKPLMHL